MRSGTYLGYTGLPRIMILLRLYAFSRLYGADRRYALQNINVSATINVIKLNPLTRVERKTIQGQSLNLLTRFFKLSSFSASAKITVASAQKSRGLTAALIL